jgi:hypothetical protein
MPRIGGPPAGRRPGGTHPDGLQADCRSTEADDADAPAPARYMKSDSEYKDAARTSCKSGLTLMNAVYLPIYDLIMYTKCIH